MTAIKGRGRENLHCQPVLLDWQFSLIFHRLADVPPWGAGVLLRPGYGGRGKNHKQHHTDIAIYRMNWPWEPIQ